MFLSFETLQSQIYLKSIMFDFEKAAAKSLSNNIKDCFDDLSQTTWA